MFRFTFHFSYCVSAVKLEDGLLAFYIWAWFSRNRPGACHWRVLRYAAPSKRRIKRFVAVWASVAATVKRRDAGVLRSTFGLVLSAYHDFFGPRGLSASMYAVYGSDYVSATAVKDLRTQFRQSAAIGRSVAARSALVSAAAGDIAAVRAAWRRPACVQRSRRSRDADSSRALRRNKLFAVPFFFSSSSLSGSSSILRVPTEWDACLNARGYFEWAQCMCYVIDARRVSAEPVS
jgi:hypothetical protein